MSQTSAELLFDRFVCRPDVYARQIGTGEYVPARANGENLPLTMETLKRHMKGDVCCGTYQLRDDVCKWFAYDLDGLEENPHNATGAAHALVRACRHFSLEPLVEFTGKKGYRVWVLHEEIQASVSQAIARGIKRWAASEFGEEYFARCSEVAIFPKQTTVDASGMGNLVKLPWGKRADNAQRGMFTDPETLAIDESKVVQRGILERSQIHPASSLLELAATHQWKARETTTPRRSQAETNDLLAPLFPILTGCAWFRHCAHDAHELTEPEWYAMLTVIGRCEGGIELAHEWSRPYPGYTEAETGEKLQHAIDAPGPYTCAYIEEEMGGARYCPDCVHRGRIKSPMSLARGFLAVADDLVPPEAGEESYVLDEFTPPQEEAREEAQEPAELPFNGALAQQLEDELDENKGKRGKKEDPSELTLARRWAKEVKERFAFFEGSQWWEYGAGRWRYSSSEHAEAEVQRYMERMRFNGIDMAITATKVSNVLRLARAHLGVHKVSSLNARPTLIPLRNGVFDTESSRLVPHSPEFFLTNQLPFDYLPNAECPRWLRFLDEVLLTSEGKPCTEWIDAIQEWFGYSMVPDNSAQVSMIWVGEGRNGKGVAARILENLLGSEQCCAVPVEQLHDPYHRAELQGKLVGFVNEPDPRAMLKNGAYFKAITGGDTISARRPTEKVFSFVPFCRLVISTNSIPGTRDLSHGYFRRLLILEWRKQIEAAQVDTSLDAVLRQERPGIFNWALEGLKRFRMRGSRFSELAESDALLAAYKLGEDPLRQFITDECEIRIDYRAPFNEFWKRYRVWCVDGGYRDPGTTTSVGRRLDAMGFRVFVDKDENRKSIRIRKGLKLKEVEEEEPAGLFTRA